MLTTVFNGKTYYAHPEKGGNYVYFRHNGKYLHRDVWKFYNGPIPPKHHIHHKDGNRRNNSLGNLECLPYKTHAEVHRKHWTKGHLRKARQIMSHARKFASLWHKSDAGREWHRKNGRASWHNRKAATYRCVQCSKTFKSRDGKGASICSPACFAAQRRDSGKDNESRLCQHCHKNFLVNKYSHTRFCSRICARHSRM